MAKNWLDNYRFVIILWPAQSADLNPIKHLWKHVKDRLKKYEMLLRGILEF